MANDFFNDGSTDQLYSTPGNWSNGTVPTLTDNAILEGGRTQNSMLGETITIDFDGLIFHVKSNYTGDVGETGTHLAWDNAVAKALAKIELYGTGKYWIDLAADATCDECNINADGVQTTDHVNLGGAGIWTLVNVLKGLVNFNATNAGAVEVRTGWSRHPNDAIVVFGSSARVTTIDQNGGRITNAMTNNITTWDVNAGSARVTGAAGTITNLNVNGGTFRWDPSGGTPVITTLKVRRGGIMDLSKSGDERTITNAVVFPGGILDVHGVEDQVTFTNRPVQVGQQATILGDVNPKVIS